MSYDTETWTEVEKMFEPITNEVNAMIEQLNQGGTTVEPVIAEDIYYPLLEAFVKEAETKPLDEMLVRANPYLAVELGFLTKREAIRAGFIPLHKTHLLEGTISYKELSKDIVKALNLSAEDYERLGI